MKALKRRPDGLLEVDHRSLRAIEAAAKEVLEQCAHLRKNANDNGDRIRFLVINTYANHARIYSQKARQRYYREKGWKE